MFKLFLIAFGFLVQAAVASFETHNVTIQYSAATDEVIISCFVPKGTWFGLAFAPNMDTGGGVVFRGEGASGNSSGFFMRGHDDPGPNPIVPWTDVKPAAWDGETYFFSVRRPLTPAALTLKHPIVKGHHGPIIPAPAAEQTLKTGV